MFKVLKSNSTSPAVGAKGSAFMDYLSVDGLRVTQNIGAVDYTSSPVNFTWIAPKDAIVTMLTVGVGDVSVAQTASFGARFLPDTTALTVRYGIYDTSLNAVQDITINAGQSTTWSFQGLGTASTIAISTPSATAGNNEFMSVTYFDFVKCCGGGLFVKAGHHFGIVGLTGNLASITQYLNIISGFFVN